MSTIPADDVPRIDRDGPVIDVDTRRAVDAHEAERLIQFFGLPTTSEHTPDPLLPGQIRITNVSAPAASGSMIVPRDPTLTDIDLLLGVPDDVLALLQRVDIGAYWLSVGAGESPAVLLAAFGIVTETTSGTTRARPPSSRL